MKGFAWLGKLLGASGDAQEQPQGSTELISEDQLTTDAGSTGAMQRQLDAEEENDIPKGPM